MKIFNIISNALTSYLVKKVKKSHPELCDFKQIAHELRPADVLLIEGKTRMAKAISRVTQSSWTHSSIYIGRIHDIEDISTRELLQSHYKGSVRDQLVIESYVGRGTIVSPITDYEEDHIRICRPTGISHEDTQKVINFAVEHVGREYDTKQIIDLAFFCLKWSLFPWRWWTSLFTLKNSQSQKEVCSEMIAHAFSSVDFPILPLTIKDDKDNLKFIHRNPRLCVPKDFDYSPYFQIIKYPMWPADHKAAYKKFPWQKDTVSNDELGITKTDPD